MKGNVLVGTLAVSGVGGITYIFALEIRENILETQSNVLNSATDIGEIIGDPFVVRCLLFYQVLLTSVPGFFRSAFLMMPLCMVRDIACAGQDVDMIQTVLVDVVCALVVPEGVLEEFILDRQIRCFSVQRIEAIAGNLLFGGKHQKLTVFKVTELFRRWR